MVMVQKKAVISNAAIIRRSDLAVFFCSAKKKTSRGGRIDCFVISKPYPQNAHSREVMLQIILNLQLFLDSF